MTESDIKITLIGSRLAREGLEFIRDQIIISDYGTDKEKNGTAVSCRYGE